MYDSDTVVISIANQKGGVGKTTTAINLATSFTTIGHKILLIDLDPQGNASTGLGVNTADRKKTMYDVLIHSVNLSQVIHPTQIPNLFIATADINLNGVEIELMQQERRSHRLKFSLEAFIKYSVDKFDYIFIDCPPSLNLLTVNALTASHRVLVPLQTEFFALEGLSQLMNTVQRIKMNLNPQLEIMGVILTMYDKRNNLSLQVAEDVRKYFKNKVYDTVIPRNVKLSEASSHGIPAVLYDQDSIGSKAYLDLAVEMLHKFQIKAYH